MLNSIIAYIIEKKIAFLWLIVAIICGITAYKNIKNWRR